MPEQQSARAVPVTTAPIESPFQTEIYPYGVGGLNAKDARDKIPVGEFAVHTNLTHSADRGLTVRPTLSLLATGGTIHHSVRRLHNPNGTDTRFWGLDSSVYRGVSGALTLVEGGYSGNPLTLLPHRPTLSGEPWMFVADSSRMRKIKSDGTSVPIGLPAPTVAATVAAGDLFTTRIAAFDTSDGTDAASWTPVAGFDRSTPANASATPLVLDAFGLSGSAVAFRAYPGAAQTTYCAWWGRALNLDLSTLQGGAVAASDQDAMHIWVNMSHPQFTEEIRIYLVCSNNFDPTQLPGLTGSTNNTDFYVKGFRQNDFSQAIQAQEALVDAAETARIRALRNQSLSDRSTGYDSLTSTSATESVIANQSPANAQTLAAGAGAEEWIQFGVVDVPFRRGDFQRYGNTPGVDWSTITGIIVYLSSTATGGPVEIRLDDFFLYGGSGPDDMEPGTQPFDWRYTHYDPRTGAESNPSPTMATANKIDLVRRSGVVTPTAYGDGNIRQRFYRRGGTNINDWFFAGTNTADGALFTDSATDDTLSTAGTVNLDHYQPVPTVDAAGTTVLAQPVPILFGPSQGILFALGDPLRPGHLYWCLPDEPDHWPAENNIEVCSPSEELQAGLMLGAQPYCFSRERLYAVYPSLSNTSAVTVATTACRRGLVNRWGWAIGLGLIFGVAKDAIFATAGGTEEVVSIQIEKLFRGQTWNGYSPVDFTVPAAIRLSVFRDQLFFTYQGTDTARHTLVYHLLYKYWTAYEYAGVVVHHLTAEDDNPIATQIVGAEGGTSYTTDPLGTSDNGTPVTCIARSGDWDLGRPREDKLLGDLILDVDTGGETITITNFLNNQTVTNPSNTITAQAGRTRAILDVFGTTPQRARTITTDVRWTSAVNRPTLYYYGLSILPEPDLTVARVTQWDDLGHPDESYVTGVTFDCDTGGVAIQVFPERDFGGQITEMVPAALTVQTAGRRKVKFSWPAVQAHKVRIRPVGNCEPWILYRADWISVPEPPRIAGWDIHFEADGDQYYTGLDLYCDTEGVEKQIVVQVDGQTLTNPYTSEAFWRVTTSGRQWIHLTLPWGRGHVFHFTATDANPGLLYRHKWYTQPEPSEQANWNQNFSNEGTLADKWFKGCLFEVDTFGQSKTVTIEVDGVVQTVLPVTTSGRKVVQLAFPQVLGRILRVFPTDGNPSRPYSIVPLFDTEPYKLTRWETQETDHDVPGFHTLIDAHVTLRSTEDVTLTLTTYLNQTGTTVQDTYTIPSTNGVKDKRYVPFLARKGVLTKYLFTCPTDFHLFEEESEVLVLPWGADQPEIRHPFGNDDLDRTRSMVTATVAAARSGGGS